MLSRAKKQSKSHADVISKANIIFNFQVNSFDLIEVSVLFIVVHTMVVVIDFCLVTVQMLQTCAE